MEANSLGKKGEQTASQQFLQTLAQHLPVLAERYQVESLRFFGSYVRQEQRSGSDLDVLVSFSKTPSLLKFVALVMQDALKPHLGQRILQEAISEGFPCAPGRRL
ncbi:MAG: nucleotidyltransferase family protein [Anaerolineae bacterium]